MQNWDEFIFSDQPFEKKVLTVFEHQFKHNPVYRRFCEAMGASPDSLSHHPEPVSGSEEYNSGETLNRPRLRQGHVGQVQGDIKSIPLLPVRAFKDTDVITASEEENSTFNNQQLVRPPADSKLTFNSSGTGSMERSTHQVADQEIYRQSVLRGFRHFYDLDHAVILGYTPGYAENPHSSLIWMINELIQQDDIKKSRFLPLGKPLSQGEVGDIAASGRQLILFGAAFGLMDLVENSDVGLPSNSIVIETGGMKTHRRAMSRSKMHRRLAEGFGLHRNRIHSEYGMCELLSQAYTTGGKWFRSVPWMRVSVHDPGDAQRRLPPGRKGLLGVIDLANVHSCSFLLTGDRGVMDSDNRFRVMGRWKPDDLRGCNFLIDED